MGNKGILHQAISEKKQTGMGGLGYGIPREVVAIEDFPRVN